MFYMIFYMYNVERIEFKWCRKDSLIVFFVFSKKREKKQKIKIQFRDKKMLFEICVIEKSNLKIFFDFFNFRFFSYFFKHSKCVIEKEITLKFTLGFYNSIFFKNFFKWFFLWTFQIFFSKKIHHTVLKNKNWKEETWTFM